MFKTRSKFVLVVLLLVGLCSCKDLPSDDPIRFPPLPETPVELPGFKLTATEVHLAQAHNAPRPRGHELRLSESLCQAAAYQADWMAETDNMTHAGRGGLKLGARAVKFGYHYSEVAENVAMTGSRDVTQVVRNWMNSPGHRKNIENLRYTDIGVAVRTSDQRREYWCVVFGRPQP